MMRKKEIIRKLRDLEIRLERAADKSAQRYWQGYRAALCEVIEVYGYSEIKEKFPLPWEKS